uniref:Uncharacterized protein n=1 Tax=Glossina austeni TaxID=7395 RepID=A0A1A9VY72_GLOAU
MSTAYILKVKISKLWKLHLSPLMLKRNLPSRNQLDTFKKDMLGPVDPAEMKALFKEALKKNSDEDTGIEIGLDVCLHSPLGVVYTPPTWKRTITSEDFIIVSDVRTLSPVAFTRRSQMSGHSLMEKGAELKVNIASTSANEAGLDDNLQVGAPIPLNVDRRIADWLYKSQTTATYFPGGVYWLATPLPFLLRPHNLHRVTRVGEEI